MKFIINPCNLCGKATGLLCNRCKSIRYCSKACQSSDWPVHKLLCTRFTEFGLLSRPTEDHHKAFLFPVDEPHPNLVWVSKHKYDGGPFPKRDVCIYLGGIDTIHILGIESNERLNYRLPHRLNICSRTRYLSDGSKPNDAIHAILGLGPGLRREWYGPVLVFADEGHGHSRASIRDVTMMDFRHIVDHFYSYSSDVSPTNPLSLAPRVLGVRINCIGDREMIGRPAFESIEFAPTERIFGVHDTSDIAARVGMPLFTLKASPDAKWVIDSDFKFSLGPFSNPDATFLHLCCDPKAEFDADSGTIGWGWASQKWQNSVGSVLVVRQDMKPLHPKHIEALAQYCRNEVSPRFAQAMEEGEGDLDAASKDEVLKFICEDTFKASWLRFNQERIECGEKDNVESPI